MQIEKLSFIQGAREATGTVIIIDVFRAFSVACYCFAQGAETVIPVGEIDHALALSKTIEGSILIGERQGKKLPGFDLGNSPTEVLQHDFTGKTVIHTTHAGTQGIVNAIGATEILTGAFVNAQAIANYIKQKNINLVSLVRMGLEGRVLSDEDSLCADYIESLLRDSCYEEEHLLDSLKKSSFSERFFDPQIFWNPESDFYHCLAFNRFNFILRAVKHKKGYLNLEKVELTF